MTYDISIAIYRQEKMERYLKGIWVSNVHVLKNTENYWIKKRK